MNNNSSVDVIGVLVNSLNRRIVKVTELDGTVTWIDYSEFNKDPIEREVYIRGRILNSILFSFAAVQSPTGNAAQGLIQNIENLEQYSMWFDSSNTSISRYQR